MSLFRTHLRPTAFKFRSVVLAFVIQLVSVFLVFSPAYFFKIGSEFLYAPWLLVFLHAFNSALFAYILRLEWWWVVIEFLLPFGFIVAILLSLSSWIYVTVFLILFLIYGAAFRSRVPYYPSPDHVPELLGSLLPEQPFSFLDVGSGFGKILLRLSNKFPHSYFFGVELSIAPFIVSWLRGHLQNRSNFSVSLKDFHRVDFGDYDVVYAYLSPVVMGEVWQKACQEMRRGTLFISYEFNVHGRTPDFEIQCQKSGVFLFCWKM